MKKLVLFFMAFMSASVSFAGVIYCAGIRPEEMSYEALEDQQKLEDSMTKLRITALEDGQIRIQFLGHSRQVVSSGKMEKIAEGVYANKKLIMSENKRGEMEFKLNNKKQDFYLRAISCGGSLQD